MLQAEEFWQYSLHVYGLEEVKQQCLSLQNEYGLNVNIVLLCGFLTQQQIFVSAEILKTLGQQIEKSDRQLQALRGKRNEYKSTAQELYRSVLEQELILEKSQQAELILILNSLTNNDTDYHEHREDNFISYYDSLESSDEKIFNDIMSTKAKILHA